MYLILFNKNNFCRANNDPHGVSQRIRAEMYKDIGFRNKMKRVTTKQS